MRCFKLLGARVMHRDFDRQVADLQVRATILNRFTPSERHLRSAQDQSVKGKGYSDLQGTCATKPLGAFLIPNCT